MKNTLKSMFRTLSIRNVTFQGFYLSVIRTWMNQTEKRQIQFMQRGFIMNQIALMRNLAHRMFFAALFLKWYSSFNRSRISYTTGQMDALSMMLSKLPIRSG